jgi:predicted nucleotidyltransferase
MKRSPRDALALCASYPTTPDPRHVHAIFNRPGVAAAYLFGSLAYEGSHSLSDIDLAYLGTDSETEERLYDPLYEALQRLLGEGNFDLLPLRRASLHLQFHVAMEGSLVLVRDPIAVEDFAARALMRYLDFKPYRDAYFAAGG